jgi:Ser/Thr protein kinase RdoA (MazF antagonist)
MDTAGRVRAVWSRDRDRLTDEQAARAALATLRRNGIEDPIERLRASANHVFRAGDVVVRVAPRSADVDGQVALARWLRSEGFLVAVPLAEPELVDNAKVTLWEHIRGDADRPIDFEQLGEIVARLPAVPPARLTSVVDLPFFADASWLAVEENLALAEAANVVGTDGLNALRRQCIELRGWQDRAREEDLVVCHGDVHPHNVLMRGADVVLIDWDAICLGPPAWDHAALMTWPDRWGGAPATYRDFARGYGADLRDDPLAQELATLRLLAPTINMIINGAREPVCAAEAKIRMRYWLGDPDAPTWTPL